MTAGEKVDPAALPGKWPAEHLAVRQASFGPKPSTNEHNSPLVGDQTGRPSDQPAESGTHDQHEDEVSLPSTKDSLQKNAVQDHKYSGKAQAQYGRTADRMVEGTLQNPDSGTSAFQQQFQNIDIAGRSKVHFGNIINNFSPDIFGGLHALQLDSIDDVAARYRESRASVQYVSNLPTMPTAYMPYASVKEPELKNALIKIAVVCQFLDAGFAEYFRCVIAYLSGTKKKLEKLQEQICSRQSGSMHYAGAFGEYCERINTAYSGQDAAAQREKYQTRATGEDVHPYLQDALEVPYWSMMADQFIKSSHLNNQLTYEALLSVINDKRRELKLRLQQIKQKWRDLPEEIEAGVTRRILVLDAILAQTSDKYDSLEEQQIQLLQRSPTSGHASKSLPTDPKTRESAIATVKVTTMDGITDLEKVSLLSIFFLFSAIAMVPFGMGFAGSWNAAPIDAIGSSSDPDFKWLIATTLLAILGNLYAIVPLRKITRGSTANIVSQAFLYFSIALGVWSVSVYPFWNKAWSSSLSFFCNFFAIGSVFITAQYTSDTATGELVDSSKVKKE